MYRHILDEAERKAIYMSRKPYGRGCSVIPLGTIAAEVTLTMTQFQARLGRPLVQPTGSNTARQSLFLLPRIFQPGEGDSSAHLWVG